VHRPSGSVAHGKAGSRQSIVIPELEKLAQSSPRVPEKFDWTPDKIAVLREYGRRISNRALARYFGCTLPSLEHALRRVKEKQ
jgi:hypothetical protein